MSRGRRLPTADNPEASGCGQRDARAIRPARVPGVRSERRADGPADRSGHGHAPRLTRSRLERSVAKPENRMGRRGRLAEWCARLASAGVDEVQFEWVDRGGRRLQSISEVDSYTNFDLSPDGSFIATTRRRGEGGGVLFLIDTRRNITTPISDRDSAAPISDPTWSPDGRQLVYRRGSSMVLRNAFGGEERTISDWVGQPDSWSRDGRFLIVGRPRGPAYELWAVAMNRHAGRNPARHRSGAGRRAAVFARRPLGDLPRIGASWTGGLRHRVSTNR